MVTSGDFGRELGAGEAEWREVNNSHPMDEVLATVEESY
jgi:hypothetical protein